VSRQFRLAGTEPLLQSHVFNVERRTIELGDTTFQRDVVTHQGAIAVLAINDDGEVGLIAQYRAPFDAYVLEIPAGTLDVDGEDPLDAAKRELSEELGCTATRWRLLGRFMVSPGWCDQVMTIYEARGLTLTERHPEGPEETTSEVHWATPDELKRTLRRRGIMDSTMAVALHRVYGTFFDADE
jgi:8-oxo-dGTP pyrophosphatase MutT (NUDIX family)